MRKIVQSILGATLLISTLAITPAQAELPFDPQDRFAGRFTESGRIERVDLKHHELVIDDSARKLASDIKIYAANGDTIALESLKRGMNIAFNIAMDQETHAPIVTEIVILPSE